jgi:hypothetical protein
VRRFDNLGANWDRVILNDEPRSANELLAALDRDLATFGGIGCVVVDTLSRVLSASGIDPNSSREVEPVIARLVDFFHRQNVAATLLYHTGKGGREYRGSTAIGATVDDILTLRRRGQAEEDDFDDESADDGRRLLVQDGRNLRGRLHLTCIDGKYRLYEDTSPPRRRILAALRDNGAVDSRAKLVKLAGVRKTAGLRATAELIVDGAIVETNRRLDLTALGTAELSSPQFPDAGTTPEPHSGTSRGALNPGGSHSCTPLLTEMGTTHPSPPLKGPARPLETARLSDDARNVFDQAVST